MSGPAAPRLSRRRRALLAALVGLLLAVGIVVLTWHGLDSDRRLGVGHRGEQALNGVPDSGISVLDPAAGATSPASGAAGQPGSSPRSGGPGAGGPGVGGNGAPGSGPVAPTPTGGDGSGPGSGGPGGGGSGTTGPIGDGTYTVGVDIAAGDWSTGPLTVTLCQYRVNNLPLVRITVSLGLTTVHLAAGDSFTTSGCGTWRHDG